MKCLKSKLKKHTFIVGVAVLAVEPVIPHPHISSMFTIPQLYTVHKMHCLLYSGVCYSSLSHQIHVHHSPAVHCTQDALFTVQWCLLFLTLSSDPCSPFPSCTLYTRCFVYCTVVFVTPYL
jgi:hypothetical protein